MPIGEHDYDRVALDERKVQTEQRRLLRAERLRKLLAEGLSSTVIQTRMGFPKGTSMKLMQEWAKKGT